ncbi:MAG: hypothetical protein CW338_05920 [Clostridiales bacterium]|nr:hypothetical protein [Clostridiales bacterium]
MSAVNTEYADQAETTLLQKIIKKMKGLDWVPAVLFVLSAGLVLLLHVLANGNLDNVLRSTAYNTYTRQAMAWRDGMLHLPYDVPLLELAVYEGEYYVSFPPVPSLVELPLTFIFGMETPDNLLMLIYITVSCESLYFAFKKRGISRLSSALFSYFLCFGCCILLLCIEGAVWYHAQLLAFLCMSMCLCFFSYDHPTPALIFYALSVGCRPFNALYGAVFGLIYLMRLIRAKMPAGRIIRRLLPGICAGFGIAVMYGAYNYMRFGNVFEFGHNYLPEFSTQGGIQFSLSHVPKNAKTFIWGLPFEVSGSLTNLNLKIFGFSVFIACPALTIMLVQAAADIIRKRFTMEKALILLAFAVQLFLLLLHRTFGGYQFGARYACDLLIYPAAYICLRTLPVKREGISPETVRISGAEIVIYVFALLFSAYGTCAMHL